MRRGARRARRWRPRAASRGRDEATRVVAAEPDGDAGDADVVHYLSEIRKHAGFMVPGPAQAAAVAALDGPQDCVNDIRRIYRTRRDALVESFTRAGWPVPSPRASMFAWAPIPEKLRHLGSLEFSIQLINEAHVAVAPGAGFGEHGDEYVRIALVENEQRIRQAGRNIRKFLAAHGVKEIKPVAAE